LTVKVTLLVTVTPRLSFTVRVTVNVPAVV
jgi:hypothetical protein